MHRPKPTEQPWAGTGADGAGPAASWRGLGAAPALADLDADRAAGPWGPAQPAGRPPAGHRHVQRPAGGTAPAAQLRGAVTSEHPAVQLLRWPSDRIELPVCIPYMLNTPVDSPTPWVTLPPRASWQDATVAAGAQALAISAAGGSWRRHTRLTCHSMYRCTEPYSSNSKCLATAE